ncbi:unnamed protein product [Orchesella dallaii]|uniref:Uncharacterized protein n=1 Tax=Orchesella dallaii TaxID=48710 RepID=A0ABP1Q1I3_9HEXA
MLEPFQEHPIILTQHSFKTINPDTPDLQHDEQMYCDGAKMKLLPNQKLKFKAPPFPKANCFVQLYIDPFPCEYWAFWNSLYFQSGSNPFDRMYLNPWFDYRSEDKTTEFMSDYNLAKSGLFFAHIIKRPVLKPYSHQVLFKIDYSWQQANRLFNYNFIQPIKYVLAVAQEDGDTSSPFLPVGGGLLTCHNYYDWWKRLEKTCELLSKRSSMPRTGCLSMYIENVAEYPGLLEIDGDGSNTQTWRDTENLIAKSRDCHGHNLLVGSPSKKPKGKIDKFYLGDLKRKELQGEDTDGMEYVILSLLFPNATMFGGEQESLFFTAQFFPFVTVVKTVTMFTESVGYTGKLSEVHFITCAPVAEGSWLSLTGLVVAFQGPLWLTLGIASVVSGLALHFVLHVSNFLQQKRVEKASLFDMAFVWDVLLGQGNVAVEKIKWIGGSWALIGVVVTNAYLGDNITMLTAPLPVKRVETFAELFSNNFSIHSSVPSSSLFRMVGTLFQSTGEIIPPMFGGLLGEWPETVFTKLFIKAHSNLSYMNARATAWKVEKYQRKMYKTRQDMASTRDMNYFLKIIGRCKRDAFVEAKDTLDRTKLKLKKGLWFQPKLIKQLTMSKDSYGELIENWKFANIPWPATNFLIRTHGLLESGLVPLWKGWIHWIATIQNEFMVAKQADGGYKAISLNGNIRALFFLYLALSIIPILFFALGFKTGGVGIICVNVHIT